MSDLINTIFQSIQNQFINPIGSGLWGAIAPVWFVAFAISVLSLIFGFGSMQRGPKIAVVAGLALFGYVMFSFGGDIVTQITAGAVSASTPSAETAMSAVEAAEAARDAVSAL